MSPRHSVTSKFKDKPGLDAKPLWSQQKLRDMNRRALTAMREHHRDNRDLLKRALIQNMRMDGKLPRAVI